MLRQLSEDERKALRLRQMKMVEENLPLPIRVPVPPWIRNRAWFQDFHLDKRLEIYALPCGKMDTLNGKAIPLLGILRELEAEGALDHWPIIDAASSGNFVISGGFIAPSFTISGFNGVIDQKKTPASKLGHIKASGANPVFAPEGHSLIEYAHVLGQLPGHLEINQYTHPGSIHGHEWTMNHLWRWMEKRHIVPSAFGAVTGTTSTIMGADAYLRPHYPGMKIFGVASMSKAEKVPGSRSPEDLDELKQIGGFPWWSVIDYDLVTSSTRAEAFKTNINMIRRDYISAGPTSALLLAGTCHLLRKACTEGSSAVEELMRDGKIVIMLLFMDMFTPYLSESEYQNAEPF